MHKYLIASVTALILAIAPAAANQCGDDLAAVDAALQTAQLSSGDMARVMELRQQAAAQGEAGQAEECAQTLAEAKVILGIE